ncbi:amidohydrolase family protein [bacterium]|nr:MAG: amidohydrolase family protein [bacterium]
MEQIVLRNCALLVPGEDDTRGGYDVLIEGDRIRQVSDRPIVASNARSVDVGGKTVMPGLIDCHVHVMSVVANPTENAGLPNQTTAYAVIPVLRSMLSRGYTTVRDAAGADFFLAQAIESGYIDGPRIFPSGKALSQTGGHGDFRRRTDHLEPSCCSDRLGMLTRVEDGVDSVRKATREELLKGATQIKITASGGVASSADRIDNTGFSLDEIRAIVEEAAATNTYVLAHAYTPRAIRRAIDCGVRTIEHGNLVDEETAKRMHELGVYAVPTLVTYDALAKHGEHFGLYPESIAKVADVREAGLRSLEIFRNADVKIGFGTDLLGEMHKYQSDEFQIRASVLKPSEIIASATATNAEILRMQGQLGCIEPGAFADLLVVDGNPLRDISLLAGQGEHLTAIMKSGCFFKNELA